MITLNIFDQPIKFTEDQLKMIVELLLERVHLDNMADVGDRLEMVRRKHRKDKYVAEEVAGFNEEFCGIVFDEIQNQAPNPLIGLYHEFY